MAQTNSNAENEGLLSYFFSDKGFFGRTDFIGVVVFHLLLRFSMKHSLILNDIVYLAAFYGSSVAIQKRCRDINWTGTVFIFFFFLMFPILNYYQYMKENGLVISKV